MSDLRETVKVIEHIDSAIAVLTETRQRLTGGDLEPLLTVRDVASHLKSTKQHVYNLITNGSLRVARIGSAIRVTKSDLIAYIEASK